jgi:hypothetical protein
MPCPLRAGAKPGDDVAETVLELTIENPGPWLWRLLRARAGEAADFGTHIADHARALGVAA